MVIVAYHDRILINVISILSKYNVVFFANVYAS